MTRKLYTRECQNCGAATLAFRGEEWTCPTCGVTRLPAVPPPSDELAEPIPVTLTEAELKRAEQLAVVMGGSVSDVLAAALAAFARGARQQKAP